MLIIITFKRFSGKKISRSRTILEFTESNCRSGTMRVYKYDTASGEASQANKFAIKCP